MATYLALLRGINVSGQNTMRMPELQDSCASLGLGDVRTYLQSGNVIFSARRSAASRLATAIQAKILRDFGYEVPVLVMPRAELDLLVNSNPLRPQSGAEEKTFHATFLFAPVAQSGFQALELPAAAGETALLLGRTVLLHCPHGYGRTKLNNGYFERALGVVATTRNWRTVRALQQLCETP